MAHESFIVICLILIMVSFEENAGVVGDPPELQIIGEIPYYSFRVGVFESKDGTAGKMYYYTPISLLDPESLDCRWNYFAENFELVFQVEMWNEEIEDIVWKFITDNANGQNISRHIVHVLPVESINIRCIQCSGLFILSRQPLSYFDLSQKIEIGLISPFNCNSVAKALVANPSQLSQFSLHYQLRDQTLKHKEVQIRMSNIASTLFYSKIRLALGDKDVVYLRQSDQRSLVAQIVEAIKHEHLNQPRDVLTEESALMLGSIVSELLAIGQVMSTEDSFDWNLVFWEEGFRPDEVAKRWNTLFQASALSANLSQDFTSMLQQITCTNCSGIGIDTQSDSDNHMRYKLDEILAVLGTGDLRSFIKYSEKYVVLLGDKFVPRLLPVYKVNLGHVRRNLTSDKFRISYFTSPLGSRVKIPKKADSTRLERLSKLEQELYSSVSEFSKKLNGLMDNIHSTKRELKKEFAVTIKEEIASTLGTAKGIIEVSTNKTLQNLINTSDLLTRVTSKLFTPVKEMNHCPARLYELNSMCSYVNVTCFCYIPITKNWNDASKLCQIYGMKMVALESENKFDSFLQWGVSNNWLGIHVWTGGRRETPTSPFYWATINTTFAYIHNFYPTYPKPEAHFKCVGFVFNNNANKGVFNYDCNTAYNTVCEW